ncbi:hybrid sensor histidine kinase/response regulator [Roseicyclus marinus]|uniref:hybrid sensor histidine kinase/response regulator n=1 Tax=Roseicyclus marinus TaxID=2161673 RepID=UPI00240FBD69|nr:PAS domain-containing protein [Roseicyclus marinus]MDG3041854.1 PAS domain-containing protein [Roseicyclus marinus]
MRPHETLDCLDLPQPLVTLFEGLPVAAALHDPSGENGVCFVNEVFTATFGYAPGDVPDLASWAARVYPDPAYRRAALARCRSIVEAQRRTGRVQPPVEHLITDKAGRSRNVQIGVAPQGDFVLLTFQDITGLRQTEARERAKQAALDRAAHALTEDMPGGAFTMLLEPGQDMARFTFASRHFLDLMGVERDRVLADPMAVLDCIPDEDREPWIAAHRAAFCARTAFSREMRTVVGGETRWVRADAVPRDLGYGWFVWEGVMVDITPLRVTEQRLERVLDAAQAYVWSLDLPSGLTVFNDRWAQSHGLAPVQHLDTWMKGVHPEDRHIVRDAMARIRAGEIDQATCIYRRRNAAGAWRWIKVFAGVNGRDATGRPHTLSGVSFDITAEQESRIEAQETQASLREELQRAHQRETVAQVAGGLAHDLNNLIGLVLWNIEKLDPLGARDADVAASLSQMRRAVDMSRDLIGGLEGLWHPETARSDQDLGALLSAARDLIGWGRAKRHDLRVAVPALPLPIWGNPTEILQVLMNLTLNACDAGTPDRPARVDIAALEPGTARPGCHPDAGVPIHPETEVVMFTITDTGTGITADVRDRMFRHHFTTKGARGTGLGLPIVARILQHNKAAMWIDTAIGTGTTMTIAWPATAPRMAEPPEAGAQPEPTAGVPVDPSLLAGTQALVVDDLPDVAMVLAAMLETAGAAAYCETDADLALQMLAETPGMFSVLVTDLHMQGMDGLALARQAALLDPPIPTVLVTARAEMLAMEDRTAFAAVLPKPVSSAEMVQAVRKAVNRA